MSTMIQPSEVTTAVFNAFLTFISMVWTIFITSFSVSFFVSRALAPYGTEDFVTALWTEITEWVPFSKEPAGIAYYPDIPASKLELDTDILESLDVPELSLSLSLSGGGSSEDVNGGRATLQDQDREEVEVERMLEPCDQLFYFADDVQQPVRPIVDLRRGPWRVLPSPGHLAPPAIGPSGFVVPDEHIQVVPAIVFSEDQKEDEDQQPEPEAEQPAGFLEVPQRNGLSRLSIADELYFYYIPPSYEYVEFQLPEATDEEEVEVLLEETHPSVLVMQEAPEAPSQKMIAPRRSRHQSDIDIDTDTDTDTDTGTTDTDTDNSLLEMGVLAGVVVAVVPGQDRCDSRSYKFLRLKLHSIDARAPTPTISISTSSKLNLGLGLVLGFVLFLFLVLVVSDEWE
ncbi:hypothetical protein EVG20_g3894 [Dentipellis fragilis]|uniref:Uncharacterized protein n=1 Tax=Dentipellis fragilis TaxID=205917 RepID=A0A4Y9YYZ7_9AGAM|nr:hypothetical protein EVG20_g3894 [Dentipellis fragilis]